MDKTALEVCHRLGIEPAPFDFELKVGLSPNVREGVQPTNGLRHPPEGDTSGWYIWGGESWSDDPDFFEPVHAHHLLTIATEVVPYLYLPPGWRFLISPGYEDVWEDESLAQV
jgi:hypothetical protein